MLESKNQKNINLVRSEGGHSLEDDTFSQYARLAFSKFEDIQGLVQQVHIQQFTFWSQPHSQQTFVGFELEISIFILINSYWTYPELLFFAGYEETKKDGKGNYDYM